MLSCNYSMHMVIFKKMNKNEAKFVETTLPYQDKCKSSSVIDYKYHEFLILIPFNDFNKRN